MSERSRTKGVFDRYSVVVTGTDPENPRGGIGYAMSGYIAALHAAGVEFQIRPTYHPHSAAGKFTPWVTEMLRLRRFVRRIQADGHMPLFYAHAGGWPSLARELTLLKCASLLGARTMIQLHSPTLEDLLASPMSGPLLCKALRRCDVVCVLSAYWKRLLSEHGVENTAVVSNPLPPDLVEKLESDEKPSPVDGPRRILSMSRLAAGKGFEQVLDAFELLDVPDVQLDIAGDGPLRDMLESRAAASSARDRIHFHGWVSGEKKSELLRRCECFFLPSRSDSFGMVFVEAMATGRPCVALAHRGVEEVVADGKTGLLIPADESTPQKLAQMVGEVLLNRSTRFQGSVCRAHVREKFSMRAVGDQITEAIAQIEA